MGELLIVIGCGVFFLLTAILSYYRFNKDFESCIKKKGGNK